MRFPNSLAKHALKMLARISLQDVTSPALVSNKYIYCAAVQDNTFKRMQLLLKKIRGHALIL